MDKMKERCLNYIREVARNRGVEYDLASNLRNETALTHLWDALMAGAGTEQLKSLCLDVLDASEIPVMQGIKMPEPKREEMEDIQTLFFYPETGLNMRDTLYVPPAKRRVEFDVQVLADDESVLKLTPGAQLSLFDMEEEV